MFMLLIEEGDPVLQAEVVEVEGVEDPSNLTINIKSDQNIVIILIQMGMNPMDEGTWLY